MVAQGRPAILGSVASLATVGRLSSLREDGVLPVDDQLAIDRDDVAAEMKELADRPLHQRASGWTGVCAAVALSACHAGAATTSVSVEQQQHGDRPPLAVRVSFEGLGVGMKAGPGTNNPPAPRNPSDNSLAVGPNHVVQIVNSRMAIYTKQGKVLYGPVPTNNVFKGFGGTCEAGSCPRG